MNSTAQKEARRRARVTPVHGGGHANVVADFGKIDDAVYLTEPEAARIAGFSAHTLKNWRIAGEGRGPRATIIRRAVRYRTGDMRAWLRSLAGPDAAL
jgi:hypothetical protein